MVVWREIQVASNMSVLLCINNNFDTLGSGTIVSASQDGQ